MVSLPSTDPQSSRSVFLQIADHIRDAITRNDLQPGDRIPSENALTRHYGVARETVRDALAVLRAEGLVYSQRGKGTFVRDRPRLRRVGSARYAKSHDQPVGQTPFSADGGLARDMTVTYKVEHPSDVIAARLNLTTADEVIARRFAWTVDRQIVQISVSYVPHSLVRDTPVADSRREPWPGGTVGQMASLGVTVNEVTEEVVAEQASPEDGALFGLGAGSPVFKISRTMFASGEPVETADITMASDRYTLNYRIFLG